MGTKGEARSSYYVKFEIYIERKYEIIHIF